MALNANEEIEGIRKAESRVSDRDNRVCGDYAVRLHPLGLVRPVDSHQPGRIQAVIATQSFPTNRRILPPVSATRASSGGDR
jgi:hypothetical protein